MNRVSFVAGVSRDGSHGYYAMKNKSFLCVLYEMNSSTAGINKPSSSFNSCIDQFNTLCTEHACIGNPDKRPAAARSAPPCHKACFSRIKAQKTAWLWGNIPALAMPLLHYDKSFFSGILMLPEPVLPLLLFQPVRTAAPLLLHRPDKSEQSHSSWRPE